jgi:hypothetical protein
VGIGRSTVLLLFLILFARLLLAPRVVVDALCLITLLRLSLTPPLALAATVRASVRAR